MTRVLAAGLLTTVLLVTAPAADASKWVGWHAWCAQHPHHHRHLAVCR